MAEAGWKTGTLQLRQLQKDRFALRSKLEALTEAVYGQEEAWPFREPVDTSLAPDYRSVVEHPMDLGTIRRKVADNAYTSLSHWFSDMERVFKNCRAYNKEDTEYVSCANKLEAFVRARMTQ